MSKIIILPLVLLLVAVATSAQEQNAEQPFRIMFYNVENLFDIEDDPERADKEFTPEGERRWNNRKLYDKLHKIYKVIMAAGEWEPPAIVGLAEVENRQVLEKLVYDTPLKNFGYRIIHHDSPDRRGIDVAMLYREEVFVPLHHRAVRVSDAEDSAYVTRDILYVKGLLDGREMIHFFINHWPSRYGGYMASVERRKLAAAVLKSQTDSLFRINPKISVVIMGDFNDDPTDVSLRENLGAYTLVEHPADSLLYNLMLSEDALGAKGSLKYRGNWNLFDQIIVSGSLLREGAEIRINTKSTAIFHAAFLLEEDETFPGVRPFRTYRGYSYSGGFSDHLPVFTDILLLYPE
ncbi:MAG: endonuclease [Bacteroidales bacterium]